MRKIILLGICLLMLTSVYATDTCTIDRECVLWADITANISFFNAASANITIRDPTGLEIITNIPMTPNGTGIFRFEYTPTEFGNYFGFVEFYDIIGVKVSQAQMSWSTLEIFEMIWTIFLIFAMGLLLAILAQYLKNAFIMTFAGIWYVLSAITTFMNTTEVFGYSVVLFFILLGALLVWHSTVMFKRFEQGKREMQVDN